MYKIEGVNNFLQGTKSCYQKFCNSDAFEFSTQLIGAHTLSISCTRSVQGCTVSQVTNNVVYICIQYIFIIL